MFNKSTVLFIVLSYFVYFGCGSELAAPPSAVQTAQLDFGPQVRIGNVEANPSTPFLRYAPDGRLFAVWTEDHENPRPHGKQAAGHQHNSMRGDRAPSPMRNVFIAASSDGGKTWSSPKRVNSDVEAAQGEENGPKVAFDARGRAHVVWSIPGGKGDKTRANIRFALDDGKGGFTPARTLNEVKDAARFPIIEANPDGKFLIAWIDRRIDGETAPTLPDEAGRRRQGADEKLSGGRRAVRGAASSVSLSSTAARQSSWWTVKWMAIKFVTTCCASPRTAPRPSARQSRSATTAGRCLPVRTPGQA
jgi:hypothetical protein